MNIRDLSRTEDEAAPLAQASDDPGCPPARFGVRALPTSTRNADAKTLDYAGPVIDGWVPHDPARIRGDALRRSLYFTLVAWIPGAFWAGAVGGAPGIELAKYLGADDFIFSLLTVAPLLSVLLQIPGSLVTERLGGRKKFFMWTCVPHRALYILVGLLPWVLPGGGKAVWPAMIMIGVLFLSMSLSNLGSQAWTNWMADLVPARIRGAYFGRRARVGLPVLAVAGVAVALLLDLCQQTWFTKLMAPVAEWSRMPPLIFLISIVFVIGGFVGMFDILSFTKVDEPPMPPVPREPLMRRLAKPLCDGEFRRFVAYWSVWTASQAFCGWVWWVYLLDFFDAQKKAGVHAWWTNHMYLAATLILSVCFQIGQFLGYPIWGRAVDRFGCKPALFVSSTLHTIGWIWWVFLSPAMLPWLFLTQMIGGFNYGGQDMASLNIMLQFNRRGGPGYQAMAAVIFSVVGAAVALLSGHLAETWLADFHWTFAAGTAYAHTFNRYAVLLAISIVIKYAGDIFVLPIVREVNEKPARHALRFVLDNTYGNLNTLIFMPLRTGAGMAGRRLDDVRETLADAAGAAGASFRRLWQ